MKKLKRMISVLWGMCILLMLVACSSSESAAPQYKGVLYKGEGRMVTEINLAIHGPEEMLFLEKVKIIDDHPTVRKVVEAVEEHRGIAVEVNTNGSVVQVNDKKNNEQSRWTLLVDNIVIDQNIEKLEIVDDQNITLQYGNSRD